MADGRYTNRRLEICFASEAELERWRERAKKSKAPLAKWVRETIENYLADEEALPRQDIERDVARIREENRSLRRELQKTEAALQLAEAQLIKAKHSAFLQDAGHSEFTEDLLDLLKGGCVYSGREILKELHIAPVDSDSIKIIHRQLQLLQSMGVIREEPRGWRWVG